LETQRVPRLFCFYRLDFIGFSADAVATTQGPPGDFR
jgi:hypothetical protein